MAYLSDIEIAQQCRMRPITEIAALAGVEERYLECYGRYKPRWIMRFCGRTSARKGS